MIVEMSVAFPLPQRFWDKVAKGAATDCWLWLGARDQKGYGLFRHDGRVIRASRLVLISDGLDMTGLQTRHACDNPPCVNRLHLSPGSARDNVQDRVERGRSALHHGENNHNSKLTAESVRRIRYEFNALRRSGSAGYTTDGSAKELAKRYGITYRNLMMIVTKQTWVNV